MTDDQCKQIVNAVQNSTKIRATTKHIGMFYMATDTTRAFPAIRAIVDGPNEEPTKQGRTDMDLREEVAEKLATIWATREDGDRFGILNQASARKFDWIKKAADDIIAMCREPRVLTDEKISTNGERLWHQYSTGYFANERNNRSGVHIIQDGLPLCGYKPTPSMQYQFCVNYVCLSYVTCKKCLDRFKPDEVPKEKQ